MGAGVSGQPVYLTRSTMLISHTPVTNQTAGGGAAQCTFRRQSTVITAPGSAGNGMSSGGGISSQLAFPIQLYPNNVYNNHGYSAQVQGFEPHPSPPTTASANHHHHSTSNATSSISPPNRPSAPSEETPPPYSSIYPNLANRVN